MTKLENHRMKISPTYRQLLLHLAWWVFYIGNFFIAQYVRNPKYEWYIIDMSLYFLSDILFFYFFVSVTAKYLFNKQTILIGIGFFLINASILYGTEASRVIWAYFAGFYDQVPKYYFQLHTLLLAYLRDVVQFTGYGTMYWFYNRFYEQQKEKVELEKRSHEIEVSFLKSQINEHFTYNMLNRFHTEASKYSEQLADGILSLSELMRYSVKEYENTMVTLSEEIKYTQMLIALNRQRLDNQVEVNFDIEGNLEQPWKIPHLCILTLVENAFKHGAIRQAPLQLHLKVTQEQLWFSTKNKIKSSTSEPSTGIGVKNLGRRLDLLCEGRAMLKARIEDEYFYTNLEIKAPCPPMGK